MLKAHIRACPNKRMTGTELRRLRVAAGMGERRLARKFGTYRVQIQRWQDMKQGEFELSPQGMQRLLSALGAGSL